MPFVNISFSFDSTLSLRLASRLTTLSSVSAKASQVGLLCLFFDLGDDIFGLRRRLGDRESRLLFSILPCSTRSGLWALSVTLAPKQLLNQAQARSIL
ncbi:hypothetical protein KC346_g18 [Hortaea werneckii]|nr:hypothetical protein KC346_g18 [Hortaea werneckii]